jgi:hypothetical protein
MTIAHDPAMTTAATAARADRCDFMGWISGLLDCIN